MVNKLIRYIKKDAQGYLKIAILFDYADVAPIKNWIKRNSIPKRMQPKLKQLIEGEINVRISIDQG